MASAGADVTVAQGQTTTLAGSAAGGTAPYTYAWQQIAGVTQGLSGASTATASVSALAAGTATFRLTVTDAAAATATDDVVVTVSPLSTNFQVTASVTQVDVVGGGTVTLLATATNGVAPISWSWQLLPGSPTGASWLTSQSTQTPTVQFAADASGAYTFEVTATDAAGATASASVVVNLTPAPPGALNFTLNIDDLAGGAGDDTFIAQSVWDSGVGDLVDTLQDGDQADGDAGADTVNATMVQGNGPTVTLTNIETLNFTIYDNHQDMDGAMWTGVTQINLVNGNEDLDVWDLPALCNIGVTNTDGDVDGIGFADDVLAAADDAVTVTLDRAKGGEVGVYSDDTNGVEILNVVSGGTEPNELDDLWSWDDGTDGSELLTVNVTGDQALEILTDLEATVETLDASASTGGVTVGFAAGADVTATGGSGDDSFDLSGGYTDADTVDGGDGTDTLGLESAEANVAAAQANVTNIEGLAITDALVNDLDLTQWASVTQLTLEAGVTAAAEVTVASGTQITVEADLTAATDITVDGDGIADTIGLTMDDADATAVVNLNGVEVCDLAVQTAAIAFLNLVMIPSDPVGPPIGTTTLNVTGDQDLTLTSATIQTIDANALTGDLIVTVTAEAAVTGGAGDDTITGSGDDDLIAGGAGLNTLDGGAGDDDIAGGADVDTITGGTGNDALAGGADADTFVFAAGHSDATGAVFDAISDFETASDVIDYAVALTIVANAAAPVATVASIDAEGIATFHADDDTLAERIAAVQGGINTGVDAAGVFAVFEHGGNSYIFISDGSGAVNAPDVVIELTGITGLSDTDITTIPGDLTIQ